MILALFLSHDFMALSESLERFFKKDCLFTIIRNTNV